jgi:hypothetical protein
MHRTAILNRKNALFYKTVAIANSDVFEMIGVVHLPAIPLECA